MTEALERLIEEVLEEEGRTGGYTASASPGGIEADIHTCPGLPSEEFTQDSAAAIIISRRKLIIMGGAGASALALSGVLLPTEAEARKKWNVLPWFRSLARVLGATALGELVPLATLLPGWLQEQITKLNKDMARAGFTTSQSTPAQSTPAQSTPAQSTPAQSTPAQSTPVVSVPMPGGQRQILYPALRPDGNVCVGIHNDSVAIPFNSRIMFEGPSLVAAAQASQDLTSHLQEQQGLTAEQTREVLRRSFLPTAGVNRNGTASFKRSYPSPDTFRTQAGTLEVEYDYNAQQGDAGVATVKAYTTKINPRGLLWEQTVTLDTLV